MDPLSLASGSKALSDRLENMRKGLTLALANAFLLELFHYAAEFGFISCRVEDSSTYRLRRNDDIVCELDVPLGRSKLRSMAARLAVLCHEWSGQEFSPYGGEFELTQPDTGNAFSVRFNNVNGDPWIEIHSLSGSQD